MSVFIHFCSTCGEFTAIATGTQCVKCADTAQEDDRPPVEIDLDFINKYSSGLRPTEIKGLDVDEAKKLVDDFIAKHGFDPTEKTSS